METRNTRIVGVILLSAVISAAGCSALPIPSGGGGGGTTSPQLVSGKGLEVTQFKVSDKTLSPGQTASVTLKLKNYHTKEIDLQTPTLYNIGLLEKSDRSCTPSEIESAKVAGDSAVYPEMECTWRITAPSGDIVGGFEQRAQESIVANIAYNSSIENNRPMKINFRPLSDVNRTSKKRMTFSNSEVEVSMETENPVPLNQNKSISFDVATVGSGRVSDAFEFDYAPGSVFVEASDYGDSSKADVSGECPATDKMVLEDRLDFSCSINSQGQQEVVRNLFFTASYKYVQAPSLGITIVK